MLYGYLFPRLCDAFLAQVPSRYIRLGARMGIVGAFLIVFSIVWLRFGPLAALVAGLVLAILFLVSIGAWRKLRLWRIRRQAHGLLERARRSYNADTFTRWTDFPVDEKTRQAVEHARGMEADGEIVIGSIDQDIRVHSVFGSLPILPSVSQAEFFRRPRFQVDVVLLGDLVLIRKDYRGNEASFLNEWRNLAVLWGRANVPAIYKAEDKRCVLYLNLVMGQTVRDLLLAGGARIMDVQLRSEPEVSRLNPEARARLIVSRGAALMAKCVPGDLLQQMEEQISQMHACGMTRVVPTFGNVIREAKSGAPFFIDFEASRFFPGLGPLFRFERDRDRHKFMERFGRRWLTESSARAALAESYAARTWYAPVDFGDGLAVGHFWSTKTGTGRWELFKPILAPLVVGKTILDLGSNNGIMPLMMLRAGALRVTGLELSAEFVDSARLVHSVFEWHDMRKYDLQMLNCNMLEILDPGLGPYDLVTSFCSLYYLSVDEMARVVRRAAELAPVMIVQANTGTRASAGNDKAKKSSLAFLKRLLECNGYPDVEVHTRNGNVRPLLIGRRGDAPAGPNKSRKEKLRE